MKEQVPNGSRMKVGEARNALATQGVEHQPNEFAHHFATIQELQEVALVGEQANLHRQYNPKE